MCILVYYSFSENDGFPFHVKPVWTPSRRGKSALTCLPICFKLGLLLSAATILVSQKVGLTPLFDYLIRVLSRKVSVFTSFPNCSTVPILSTGTRLGSFKNHEFMCVHKKHCNVWPVFLKSARICCFPKPLRVIVKRVQSNKTKG